MYIARGDMNNVSYYCNQINVGQKVWIHFSLGLVFKKKKKNTKPVIYSLQLKYKLCDAGYVKPCVWTYDWVCERT